MWLTEKHRFNYFKHSIIPGFISLFLPIGFAIGRSYDEKYDKFHWNLYRNAAIILGGLLGAVCRYIIIFTLWF